MVSASFFIFIVQNIDGATPSIRDFTTQVITVTTITSLQFHHPPHYHWSDNTPKSFTKDAFWEVQRFQKPNCSPHHHLIKSNAKLFKRDTFKQNSHNGSELPNIDANPMEQKYIDAKTNNTKYNNSLTKPQTNLKVLKF